MASNKKYWKSIEELNPASSVVEGLKQNEFAEPIPTDQFLGDKETLERSSTTRRDFLKYVGFSTAAASLAACEGPVIKSIPYVVAPDEIVPGVSNYYATTISDGFDFASVLVKTREGRPIKIERNDLGSDLGGVNARVHASVLSMYDKNRLMGPMIDGQATSWLDLGSAVDAGLSALAGQEVTLLTQSFASPSTAALIQSFTKNIPTSSTWPTTWSLQVKRSMRFKRLTVFVLWPIAILVKREPSFLLGQTSLAIGKEEVLKDGAPRPCPEGWTHVATHSIWGHEFDRGQRR